MSTEFNGKAWKLTREKDLLIASFDLEGERVNKLAHASVGELKEILALVRSSDAKALLIRSLKKGSFVVGADINLIKTLKNREEATKASAEGQAVFNEIEDLKIPTLAAIDGPCMGGGTEMSLACRHRVCSDSEKTAIALPEVKLGLLPGWGGTFRLPKLVGLPGSLEMMLEGKNIRADKALKMGLVDSVIPQVIFTEKSLEMAHALAAGKDLPGLKAKKFNPQAFLLDNFLGRMLVFKKAREGVIKATRGNYPAPLQILEVLDKALGTSRSNHLRIEAESFGKLWESAESKNLVNLFFLMEDSKKVTGTTLSEEELKKIPAVKELGILGAGVMGGGIAAQSSMFGIRCTVKDINLSAVSKAFAHAYGIFEKDLKRRRIKKHDLEKRMSLIRGQVDYQSFSSLDLVIEAIVENMDVKKKVLAELETQVRKDCLIASNTSSLRLTEMATALKDSSRFVGIHFFNPVEKMPLIEVIYHAKSRPECIAQAVQYSRAIGKTPVVVKDGPGFLVNRLLMPWLNEAAFMLEEGFSIPLLDKVAKNFGMPMGPFELMDEIGIDVGSKVGHILNEAFGDRAKASTVSDKIVAASKESSTPRFGRKTGLGFYTWDRPGGRRQEADEEGIRKIIFQGSTPRCPDHTEESLAWRMFFPMINEAALALNEGIVESPEMCDLAMIFGTGFPPFKGGLLRYADRVGLDKVVAELERLSQKYGARMQPCQPLMEKAKKGERFYKN